VVKNLSLGETMVCKVQLALGNEPCFSFVVV
jgi:hypothetical protein